MLCALDFGLTEGVNRAIAELVQGGAVGAVSCLPVSDIWPQSVQPLSDLRASATSDLKIGLSVKLTGAFSPLAAGFKPENILKNGYLPDLDDYAKAARRFALNDKLIEAECRAQLRRFTAHVGSRPQFIILDDPVLLFAPVTRAFSSALAKFQLQDEILLCPVLPKAKGTIERFKRKWVWRSNRHLKEHWQRRQMIELHRKEQLPPQASWHQDGRSWFVIRPAYVDERLQRFDAESDTRFEQLAWLTKG